jgi:hypothetical protein
MWFPASEKWSVIVPVKRPEPGAVSVTLKWLL